MKRRRRERRPRCPECGHLCMFHYPWLYGCIVCGCKQVFKVKRKPYPAQKWEERDED